MNAQDIQNGIDSFVESEIKVFPCHNLRASNLGHPCSRYLMLLIQHWDEVAPHNSTLQNIFDLGNSIEDYTIQKLKDAGFEITTPVQRSWKVEVKGGIITGRQDCMIKDTDDGQMYPVEIKGLAAQEWEKLNSVEDFFGSKKYYVRGYPAQLLTYMLHFSRERGYFVLTNKATGQIKVIQFDFDYEKGEEYLSKAERIYECINDPTGESLAESCDDMTVCQNCGLAHICTAPHNPTEADIDDGTIEEIIDRRESFREAKNAFEEANEELKSAMASKERVITGKYLITTSVIQKKEYTVPAREERRVKVQRL